MAGLGKAWPIVDIFNDYLVYQKASVMTIYSKKYDFPLYHGDPTKVICLCFIPRSASNYLAAVMREYQLGYPLEYFSHANLARLVKMHGPEFMPGLIRTRTSPTGIFSFKWNAAFPCRLIDPAHIIYLDRADRYAQARSYAIAKATGDWLKVKNQGHHPTIWEIEENVAILEIVRRETEKRIAGRDVLRIDFQDVIDNRAGVIDKIREHCIL